MILRSISAILLIILSFSNAQADEYRPAYLELKQIANDEFGVLWKVPAIGGLRSNLYLRFAADVEIVITAIQAKAYEFLLITGKFRKN
jgi:hypothetical protein